MAVMQGPREDSGFLSRVSPGVAMAKKIYEYCKKFHPKTNVMVSGVRRATGDPVLLIQCGPPTLGHRSWRMHAFDISCVQSLALFYLGLDKAPADPLD